jgi:hypothetical protein
VERHVASGGGSALLREGVQSGWAAEGSGGVGCPKAEVGGGAALSRGREGGARDWMGTGLDSGSASICPVGRELADGLLGHILLAICWSERLFGSSICWSERSYKYSEEHTVAWAFELWFSGSSGTRVAW